MVEVNTKDENNSTKHKIYGHRSFAVSGGSAVYVAAYSVFYFCTKLEIDEFVPTLLYFSYTLIMVVTFW